LTPRSAWEEIGPFPVAVTVISVYTWSEGGRVKTLS